MTFKILAVISILALAGCVTPYQKSGARGGYSEQQLSDDAYKITFAGNGFTTRDSVQTYWLYRAAELTVEKGYDIFEIQNSLFSGLDMYSEGYESYLVAQVTVIPMPMETSTKPLIERDIKLYRYPYKPHPPKSFNAHKLLTRLEPYVKGKLCDGQVCPHEKTYLKTN